MRTARWPCRPGAVVASSLRGRNVEMDAAETTDLLVADIEPEAV